MDSLGRGVGRFRASDPADQTICVDFLTLEPLKGCVAAAVTVLVEFTLKVVNLNWAR